MDRQMLAGKVAIISGASYGMGYTMAELFAKEGAKVVMTARGKEKLDAAVAELKKQGLDVTGVVADNKELSDVKKGHPDRAGRIRRLGYRHQQRRHRRAKDDR